MYPIFSIYTNIERKNKIVSGNKLLNFNFNKSFKYWQISSSFWCDDKNPYIRSIELMRDHRIINKQKEIRYKTNIYVWHILCRVQVQPGTASRTRIFLCKGRKKHAATHRCIASRRASPGIFLFLKSEKKFRLFEFFLSSIIVKVTSKIYKKFSFLRKLYLLSITNYRYFYSFIFLVIFHVETPRENQIN